MAFTYTVTGGCCCGGGGTVETTCCEELLPETLYATFAGSLAALGTVELTWDADYFGAGDGAWVGSGAACSGTVSMEFYCDTSDSFLLNLFGAFNYLSGGLHTCGPLVYTDDTLEDAFSACAGAAEVTVTE